MLNNTHSCVERFSWFLKLDFANKDKGIPCSLFIQKLCLYSQFLETMIQRSIRLRCAENTRGHWMPPSSIGFLPSLSLPLWMDTKMGWTAWLSTPQLCPHCCPAPAMGRQVTTKGWMLDLSVNTLEGLCQSKHDVTAKIFICFAGKSLESD